MTGRPDLQTLVLLRRVSDRMDREYDRPLDVTSLARAVHQSPGHLIRQFKAAYRETPYQYLIKRRIERAMTLLRTTDMSVTEVCFAVGCGSLGTFSTRFSELVGVPPSVYRAQGADVVPGMLPCIARQVTRPRRERPTAPSGIEKRAHRAHRSLSGMSDPRTGLSIHSSFLPHLDPEASLAFYRDVLGFEVRLDVGYEAMRWITVGPVGQPDTAIVLHPLGVGSDLTDGETALLTELVAKGTYFGANLATADLDATFEALVAAGADIVQEPVNQDYGLRDAAVRDPAGNLLRIQETPTQEGK